MRQNQSGFVVIVTMLVMAALLGLGLSMADQTTQEVVDSGTGSDAVRVFNAAETVAESFLTDPAPITGSSTGPAGETIRYRVTEDATLTTYLPNGGTATLDLPSSPEGAANLTWSGDAALLIASYYDVSVSGDPDIEVRYEGINPVSGVDLYSGFSNSTPDASGKSTYSIALSQNPTPKIVMIRIKALGAATNLEVTGNITDPQSHTVRTEATSVDNVSRAIEVVKTIEVPPAILDYAVYSGESIIK